MTRSNAQTADDPERGKIGDTENKPRHAFGWENADQGAEFGLLEYQVSRQM